MTRNKALRLLALGASLFTTLPLATDTATVIIAMAGQKGALLALVAMFFTWALLTLLLGNIFIAIWGTPRKPMPPPQIMLDLKAPEPRTTYFGRMD